MKYWDRARGSLESVALTLAAISWMLSALTVVGALLTAVLTVVLGPLIVLLWAEHEHPSSLLASASVLVAAATASMLLVCWRWRTAKRGRWILLGVSFTVGQMILVSLSWLDRLAVPLWIAGLPSVAIALLFALAICGWAWFTLLWGDGKGFGT